MPMSGSKKGKESKITDKKEKGKKRENIQKKKGGKLRRTSKQTRERRNTVLEKKGEKINIKF